MSKKKTEKTGTKEWADFTLNTQKGCINNCVYGYCHKKIAPMFKLMPSLGWNHPEYRSKEWIVKKIKSKECQEAKVIMYASMHDFTPDNIDLCCWAIEQLLKLTTAQLLLVSKPRESCIGQIAEQFKEFKDRIEFRFTLGTFWQPTLDIWEPECSSVQERIICIREVPKIWGYKVSVSMEPLLEPKLAELEEIIANFEYWNVASIWIGAMNYIPDAPKLDYQLIYNTFKGNPKIKFKESFRKRLI